MTSQCAFTSASAAEELVETLRRSVCAQLDSGHEDTWFLVEIPQRERFMSCRGESCTVINHES